MLLKCRIEMAVYLALSSLILVETNVAEPSEAVGLTLLVSEPRSVLCCCLGRTLCFHFIFQRSAAGRVSALGWHQRCVKHGRKQILVTILCVHQAQTFAPLKGTKVTGGNGVWGESVINTGCCYDFVIHIKIVDFFFPFFF